MKSAAPKRIAGSLPRRDLSSCLLSPNLSPLQPKQQSTHPSVLSVCDTSLKITKLEAQLPGQLAGESQINIEDSVPIQVKPQQRGQA